MGKLDTCANKVNEDIGFSYMTSFDISDVI